MAAHSKAAREQKQARQVLQTQTMSLARQQQLQKKQQRKAEQAKASAEREQKIQAIVLELQSRPPQPQALSVEQARRDALLQQGQGLAMLRRIAVLKLKLSDEGRSEPTHREIAAVYSVPGRGLVCFGGCACMLASTRGAAQAVGLPTSRLGADLRPVTDVGQVMAKQGLGFRV